MLKEIRALFAPRMSFEQFLVHFSESPEVWHVGVIRSESKKDCPLVEVCRRLTGRAYPSSLSGAHKAGKRLGLSLIARQQIIRAADHMELLTKEVQRVRFALLDAVIRMQRQQATKELEPVEETAELVGVS